MLPFDLALLPPSMHTNTRAISLKDDLVLSNGLADPTHRTTHKLDHHLRSGLGHCSWVKLEIEGGVLVVCL